MRLVDFHENIAIGRIVVKGYPAGRDDDAILLNQPIANSFHLVLENPIAVRLGDLATDGAWDREIRSQSVMEYDRVARDPGREVIEHEGEEDVVALDLDAAGLACVDELPEHGHAEPRRAGRTKNSLTMSLGSLPYPITNPYPAVRPSSRRRKRLPKPLSG